MTSYESAAAGDIWLTYLHFIDKPDVGKVRPVLVLSVEDELRVIALKITTKNVGDDGEVVFLDDWAAYGLRRPSYARIDQLFRVKKSDLLGEQRLGAIDPELLSNLLDRIASAE